MLVLLKGLDQLSSPHSFLSTKLKQNVKNEPHHFPLLDAGVQYSVGLYLDDSNSFFESELMNHFSVMLITETNPVEVTPHTISTLGTESRQNKESLPPLVDLKGICDDAEDKAEENTVPDSIFVDAMRIHNIVISSPTKNPKKSKSSSTTNGTR